jgi:Terpene synthase family 2, C-terminal metal binding
MSTSMKGSLAERLRYPFSRSELDVSQIERVEQCLSALADTYDLYSNRHKYHLLLTVFLAQCSAPHTSRTALELATTGLYIVMSCSDLRVSGLKREVVEACWKSLLSGASTTSSPREQAFGRLGVALRDQAAATGVDLSALQQAIAHDLSAMLWEQDRTTDYDGVETFLRVRRGTVLAPFYFKLWRVALGIAEPLELRWGVKLEFIESLAAELIGLSNDLFSHQRDGREGVGNAVTLVRHWSNLSVSAAIDHVIDLHNEKTRAYVAARTELLSTLRAPEPGLVAYLDFVSSCVAGNLRSMELITHQYEDSTLQARSDGPH